MPDPADAATLYAVVDGDAFAGGTLRRTTDSGATWNTVDVPGAAERDVAVIAGNLYVATTGGIYASADNGGSWTPPEQDCLLVAHRYAERAGIAPHAVIHQA